MQYIVLSPILLELGFIECPGKLQHMAEALQNQRQRQEGLRCCCACRVEDALAESDDAALLPPGLQDLDSNFTFMSGEPESSSAQHMQLEVSKQREERQAAAMKQVH